MMRQRHCCGRSGVARQLLGHNADVLASNSQRIWSLDMAAAGTPVWDTLYEEISWRSSLEQPRLCQLVLVRVLCVLVLLPQR